MFVYLCIYLRRRLTASLSADLSAFCLWLKITVYNDESGRWSVYPPPHTHMPQLISPSVHLSVRNERNLQQKQQLAGGPMSHDARHGGNAVCHSPHISAFIVSGAQTIARTFTVAHLFCTAERLACGRGMDNDGHRHINSPRWVEGEGGGDCQTPLLLTCKPDLQSVIHREEATYDSSASPTRSGWNRF